MRKGANGFGRVAVAAGAAAGSLALLAGCSVHASIGGPPAVSKSSVQSEVATTLAQQLSQPAPKVTCPGDLTAKVGTTMMCSLTPSGSTTTYPVKLKVTSVNGKQAHFNIQVSKTPGHFTS